MNFQGKGDNVSYFSAFAQTVFSRLRPEQYYQLGWALEEGRQELARGHSAARGQARSD